MRLALPLAVLLAVAGLAACSTPEDGPGLTKGTADHPAKDDVALTACTSPDIIGVVYAKGDINNHSSKRSDYSMEITLTNAAGAQVGSGFANAENVEPGQIAHWSGIAGTDISAGGNTCHVVDVTRTASL